jgi:hypothetical protein
MVGTALLVGSAFGVKHAVEADHVAAVATLIEDAERPGSTGVAWGVGHSVPILALGAAFLALDLDVPGAVATGFEAVVALVLIVLGVRVIAGREAIGTAVLRHVHGKGWRPERRGDAHRHVSVAGREIGLTHTHADEESVAVGVVHGLAGSGGVVVALAAAAGTSAAGAAFLSGFAVTTVLAMGVVAAGWGRLLDRARSLRLVAGVASVAVGVRLFAEIAGLSVPL